MTPGLFDFRPSPRPQRNVKKGVWLILAGCGVLLVLVLLVHSI